MPLQRRKSPAETRAELKLEVTYCVASAAFALALAMHVHLAPQKKPYVDPGPGLLCDQSICIS